jgi:hypothetical protein
MVGAMVGCVVNIYRVRVIVPWHFSAGRKGEAGRVLAPERALAQPGGGVVLASLRLEHALSVGARMSSSCGRSVVPYVPTWWAVRRHASFFSGWHRPRWSS